MEPWPDSCLNLFSNGPLRPVWEVETVMSTTRDWMRGPDDLGKLERPGLPLGGVVLWAAGLVVVAYSALALQHLFS
jgi:hypothetical protein